MGDRDSEERQVEQLHEEINAQQSAHVERNKRKFCISFDTSDKTWFDTLRTELDSHLQGTEDKNLKRLREMFSVKETPEQISGKEEREEKQISAGEDGVSFSPKPGVFVPKELHGLLDDSYIIEESDYKNIALELEDPSLSDDSDISTGDEFDPTFIFVRITRKVESSATHPLLQEYEICDGTENLHVVKSFKLFRLARKEVENNKEKRRLVNTEDVCSDQINSAQMNSAEREQGAIEGTRLCLEEAWKEPDVVKRSVVKRLLLNWHPDKNHEDVSFCTKVFQYIQQCLYRLERGFDLPAKDIDYKDSDSIVNDASSVKEYWSKTWFARFLERLEKERKTLKVGSSGTYDEFDGGWTARRSYFTSEEPQPYHYCAEARRWQKQAVIDLDNSMMSLQRIPNNSFNWVCYMAHQVKEVF